MSIPVLFMEIARQKIAPDLYAEIHQAAVAAERRRVEQAPTLPAAERIEKPLVAARIEAHVNGAPMPKAPGVPHIAERLEERLDIQVGPNELGRLAQMVRDGDRNVRIVKRRMETIHECEAAFMGRHFVVIYNASRHVLVTAYPKTKKRNKTRAGKPAKTWQAEVQDELAEMGLA